MDLDGGVESVDADQEERPPIPSATVCTVDELLHTTLVEDGVSVNVYGRCVTLSSCVLSSLTSCDHVVLATILARLTRSSCTHRPLQRREAWSCAHTCYRSSSTLKASLWK